MTKETPRIGILGMQGCFAPHARKLACLGAESIRVVYPDDLDACDGLIMPGGESTTMIKGMTDGLWDALKEYGQDRPVWGVCAGSILLATTVTHPDQQSLKLMDTDVVRNAYGAQNESFIASLDVDFGNGPTTEEAVFIRAPKISRCGPVCEVLATQDGNPVVVRQGHILATTFHPELSDGLAFHRLFLSLCGSS